jgi:hypothetical protein
MIVKKSRLFPMIVGLENLEKHMPNVRFAKGAYLRNNMPIVANVVFTVDLYGPILDSTLHDLETLRSLYAGRQRGVRRGTARTRVTLHQHAPPLKPSGT